MKNNSFHDKVEYPCKQPTLKESDFNVSIVNGTCEKRTFEWYKRNNSNDSFDDGVRYKLGCQLQFKCGEGACLTDNNETCIDDGENQNFTCVPTNLTGSWQADFKSKGDLRCGKGMGTIV